MLFWARKVYEMLVAIYFESNNSIFFFGILIKLQLWLIVLRLSLSSITDGIVCVYGSLTFHEYIKKS